MDKFKFRNQLPTLTEADVLGSLIEKFLDHRINLGPQPVRDTSGAQRLPGLDNHSMGTIFEELIRRFNEENNEEAGEHFTPRDVVTLMADLVFVPIADRIESGTYLAVQKQRLAARAAEAPGPSTALLAELHDLILEARRQTARAVNAGLTLLYWQVGARIRREVLREKRAEYGGEILQTLATRLEAEFGRGFAAKNLRRMVQFAEVFQEREIVVSLIRQLTWTHRSGGRPHASSFLLRRQSRAEGDLVSVLLRQLSRRRMRETGPLHPVIPAKAGIQFFGDAW